MVPPDTIQPLKPPVRYAVFDTAVVDLTEDLHDPVELLFGTQLGGGTDINRALAALQFSRKKIARDIEKVLRSAIANAQQKPGFSGDVERLYVSACYADQGPSPLRASTRNAGGSRNPGAAVPDSVA